MIYLDKKALPKINSLLSGNIYKTKELEYNKIMFSKIETDVNDSLNKITRNLSFISDITIAKLQDKIKE